ncbi:U6 snRNA-associated Sm-like protein LSm8 [Cryptococcus neoformans]|uniref:LSM2-LSM8 complex subunit LSM8 n=2 Tax=Cryptococcus neoformans TaxID=5207 RepID=A0A854QLN3_CRYNE|nr:U6 snRNA-associated Sm-like protein LSm8 [Cryptococcus neoformans var. grubii H99]AUB22149.1 U6 snRNA-associated Sm-like protein LSm8 [Cryptococcus neoformans var. grubii]OWT37753.1 U6 snRNA-associated Sm-like protein LSm8 [Cryptococcus neoformans var. grubii Bt1]OWZ36475.1 U6 snRNA-associated Sm-like protein LSm8 [Cryptococcus neoformans var. grubii AD2-60a]OWZ48144.1 U6 snRNA-associated Sm-like protein LSm8 [Cryptococcus neoformans var. grubii C23]OWZ56708.1 U6 snRNA-associated Sm-like pr|eukprot:XP_012046801.1 U6 snRNA-associated Sm-like protein LSm8 [Cryptococcus neoformans var. grubii H99]
MASIESYVDHTVQVILQDGRIIVGKLKGYDPRTNLILSDSVEREFSMEQGVEMIPLGLYVIKGDNVAVVAELDEEKDSTINYNDIRAEPLAELRY